MLSRTPTRNSLDDNIVEVLRGGSFGLSRQFIRFFPFFLAKKKTSRGAAMASGGVAAAAAGLLLCVLLAGQTMRTPADELAAAGGGDSLAVMQGEVQLQLVKAAKRHAAAEKHKVESVQFANSAQREREQAAVLKKRAVLAKNEAELQHAADEVHQAHATVEKLRADAQTLLGTVKADHNKADTDREIVMELEDKAGALSQKASEEQDTMKLVEAKQSQAAAALPKLLKDAEGEEVEATEMKAQAQKRMADSERKVAAAKHLDAIAQQKEHDAHVMRNKLVGILQKKSQILAREEKQASISDSLAKKAAQAEEEKAHTFAAEAVEKAQLAKSAATTTDEASTPETPEAEPGPEPESAADKVRDDEMVKLEAEARAADAADDSDATVANVAREEVEDTARRTTTLHLVAPRDPHAGAAQMHASHAVVQATRASNLHRAGLEAARRAAATSARQQQLAYVRQSAMMQDEKMLGDTEPGGSNSLFTTQPNELLSVGAGSSVQLEKEGLGDNAANAPLFSMLWTDPGSLKADTEDLEETTTREHRFAPDDAHSPRAMLEMATLYETGHTSRAESSFKVDMGKYRKALKEERLAHEDKVKRLDEELADLPAAGRHSSDWRQDREGVFSTMLHQPQNHWNTHGENAYSHTQKQALLALPTVHQDEEGHLVFIRRRHARMHLLHEYAGRRVRLHEGRGRREDSEGSDHADTVLRVKEELARERRRDRRLEDVTQRLQGEIDELREERGGGARTEDLAKMSRDREEHGRGEGEKDRRSRIEGARGRIRHYHERAHRGGGEQKAFHPDDTYNQEYAQDSGHVSVGEIKFQHALKDFDRTKSILREGAMKDQEDFRMPQLVPSRLPGQGLR
jgi:hypothetical protein